ncbi:hypothetical protein [Lysinibacillus xylanilyticus]|uniref:hypothetical protein n=1 Tax=Lysinibacillus xylanilyticus TaxID=582475 RepID=UPI003D088620
MCNILPFRFVYDVLSVGSGILSVTLDFLSVAPASIRHFSDFIHRFDFSFRRFGRSFRRFGSPSVAPEFLSVTFVRTEKKLSFCFW